MPPSTRSEKAAPVVSPAAPSSLDPFLHLLRFLPYGILRPPRTRFRIPSSSTSLLPSPAAFLPLLFLAYFCIVSGLIYDVIVEPPGIGSSQDHRTGAVRPVVFLPGRVNSQYIIEGLSSGFMFVLGGAGIAAMDVALDRRRPHSVRTALAAAGIAALVVAYAFVMLFVRIKLPGYLF